MVESVDTGDLKSPGSDTVRVRVPSAAPRSHPDFDRVGVGFFSLIFGERSIWFCLLAERKTVFAERTTLLGERGKRESFSEYQNSSFPFMLQKPNSPK